MLSGVTVSCFNVLIVLTSFSCSSQFLCYLMTEENTVFAQPFRLCYSRRGICQRQSKSFFLKCSRAKNTPCNVCSVLGWLFSTLGRYYYFCGGLLPVLRKDISSTLELYLEYINVQYSGEESSVPWEDVISTARCSVHLKTVSVLRRLFITMGNSITIIFIPCQQ